MLAKFQLKANSKHAANRSNKHWLINRKWKENTARCDTKLSTIFSENGFRFNRSPLRRDSNDLLQLSWKDMPDTNYKIIYIF